MNVIDKKKITNFSFALIIAVIPERTARPSLVGFYDKQRVLVTYMYVISVLIFTWINTGGFFPMEMAT